MRATPLSRVAIVAAGCLLGACSTTASNRSDAAARPGRARPGALEALAGQVAKIPPVTVDHVSLEGPAIDLDLPNAGFIQVEDLADLGRPVDVAFRIDAARFWLAPGWPDHIRYALVVRTVQLIPPALGPDDDIDPGLYQGEVLIFDLATGAVCGGVRIAADSTTYVPVILPHGADSAASQTRVIDELRRDLAARARDAARKALRT